MSYHIYVDMNVNFRISTSKGDYFMKKILATLMAISMMAISMTACGGDSSTTSEDTTTTTTTSAEAENDTNEDATSSDDTSETSDTAQETTAFVLPEGVTAEDGDAYLAFGDAQWWLQYSGEDMQPLSYGATVVHIDGDGTYTVALDANNEDAVSMNGIGTVSGCAFCAVIIKNGEALFPNQATSITIDKITIDGVDVELTSKNYSNYEDGNLRSNIFNSYVSEAPTTDVWTADGSLDGISAQIVPETAFANFSKIEVTFTISGSGATSDGDAGAVDEAEVTVEDGGSTEADTTVDGDVSTEEISETTVAE